MQKTIHYLINFLLGESNSDYCSEIGYTADQKLFSQYKVVIVPSSFFNDNSYGKSSSIPSLPLQKINNTPLLYGSPKVEKIDNTMVVHADIIASSYFLLTRYEEWVRTDGRDTHGRFLGKESLAYKADFLQRPIVEEYGRLLQMWLKESGAGITETKKQISKVFLTHDVDEINKYHSIKSLLGGIYRSIFKGSKEGLIPLKAFFGKIENDPSFTFPWIFEENKKLKGAQHLSIENICFFKSLLTYLPEDKPYYNLFSKNTQYLFNLCIKNDTKIGLHASYLSGDNPELILEEKEQLDIACGDAVKYNRHHYLRLKNVSDTETLVRAGISDDFTMGYADIAGFRLGTCKAVKWINVETKELSTLTLHPLSIMDRSLEDERYMSLNYQQALDYSKTIIDNVNEYSGELVLLWHNNSFSKIVRFSQKDLYSELLAYILKITQNE